MLGTARFARMLITLVAAGALAAPVALAQGADLYVEPRTEIAEDVQGLFNITLGIALFVFVLVEGLLIYMIVKFRKNTKVPKEETHRGHTTAEVVWTIIPAAILLFLGFLSAGTLITMDDIPDDTDFTVTVMASQFSWQFLYPDYDTGVAYNGEADWCRAPNAARCSFGDLRLQEGSRVLLRITSRDVIHAFAVPEFAVKRDAVPGKINQHWFVAPDVTAPETFFVQCMEYCGVGHHDMRATVTVFPSGSQSSAFGRPPAPAAEPSG